MPIVCLEALHTRALLASQRNKTDQADALGIAQILRAGWFKPVHVKSDQAHRMRILLAHRRSLKRKALDLENTLRHTLKAFGVKLHTVGRKGMAAAIGAATADDPLLSRLADGMLHARDVLLAEFERLSRMVSELAAGDEVCRRLMSVPGVGPPAWRWLKTVRHGRTSCTGRRQPRCRTGSSSSVACAGQASRSPRKRRPRRRR